METNNNTIVPILGMSRSGTTLLTQWLHLCGLPVGEVLNTHSGLEGNGFWEDQDFFQLNYAMLNKNKVKWKFIDLQTPINYDEDFLNQVRHFTTQNNGKYQEWAFKDPKTVLFLDAYQKVMPDAKYLIVYRHFQDTIDSMLRFDLKMMKTRRNVLAGKVLQLMARFRNEEKLAEHYLNSWVRHNQDILNLVKELDESQYFILSSAELQNSDEVIFQQLKNHFNLSIKYRPIAEIFDKGKLRNQSAPREFSLKLTENAEQIYRTFESLNSLKKSTSLNN